MAMATMHVSLGVPWGGRCRGRAQVGAKKARTVTVRAESASTGTTLAVNPGIKKDLDKVVDTVVLGEVTKNMTAYCRCWRSGTFPLCDGSHAKYNKASGDNVGPLLLKK